MIIILLTLLHSLHAKVTLLPLGDSLTIGTSNACSYRSSLKLMGNTDHIEFVGSLAEPQGCGDGELHEGIIGARTTNILSNLDQSLAKYETRHIDQVVLSAGQADCLGTTGDSPMENFQPISKSIEDIIYRLTKYKVLMIPILLPHDAPLRAQMCATWVNDRLRNVAFKDSTAVHVLGVGVGANEQFSKASGGSYIPGKTLSGKIARALLPFLTFEHVRSNGEKRISLRRREESAAGTDGDEKKDDADEYGYDWCLENYDKNECFDYYYGYDWCTENYEKDECFEYYYGYDWCVKYYDKAECHDYYYGDDADKKPVAVAAKVEPTAKPTEIVVEKKEEEEEEDEDDNAGSGSGSGSGDDYGYAWCLENYDDSECFEYYYGYKWCLDNYEDDECYGYYYPDDFEWNPETNYKWCLNFYLPNECEERYYPEHPSSAKAADDVSGGVMDKLKSPMVVGGLFVALVMGGVGFWCYKKQSDSGGDEYSMTRGFGGEDDDLL